MEKKDRNKLIITVLVCLLPMILGAVLYNRLPEQMPIHFTTNDNPDNYAHKNFALFGMPVILAIVQVICMISTTHKLKNKEKPRIAKIMEWFIPILTVLLYIIMVEFALGSGIYVGKCICLILGILFMVIGNYLPKMSYDAAKGVMHPMPSNEKTFRKMVRIMGYSFIVIGLFFLVMIVWV
ncbi:MAG: DUF1648 domain-containing protein [Clostridium sp.]|nr:DUF1648 domain-containing protein [Clostridium sp.]MCM1209655.1 DUF1648 domain-containing protein [Ruminococcus sp.]